MKPFRQHVVLAIDGGGIRGTMVAKALALVEEELGRPCSDLFQLTAGTSTGSIISAVVAALREVLGEGTMGDLWAGPDKLILCRREA